MATQRERQNFLWRPNDNSSTTLTRYSQEAELWTKAFKSANKSYNQPITFGESMGFIGLLIGFVVSLTIIIVLTLIDIIAWIRGLFIVKPVYATLEEEIYARYGLEKPPVHKKKMTEEEFLELWDEQIVKKGLL
jgi:hypothetical protein